MNVLAIGAHYDDIELGCGGAIARHVLEKDNVWGYIATQSGYGNYDGKEIRSSKNARTEGTRAARIIGYSLISDDIPTFELEANEILQGRIMKIIEKHDIDTVYTHWSKDVHHDHRNLASATLHCTKHVPRVLMYKSNWYKSDEVFPANYYVDITDTWNTKKKAMNVYESEMNRTNGEWLGYFERQARNYGLECGVEFAEAFSIVKWLR